MKKLFYLFAVTMLFAACSKENDGIEIPEEPETNSTSYNGTLLADTFAIAAVIDITPNANTSTVDVVLNDVKFAPNMPVVLDITLKGIPYTKSDSVFSFSANNVAPYINTGAEPVATYTFDKVQGRIIGKSLTLSATMAENLAPYIAGMEFLFNGTEVTK